MLKLIFKIFNGLVYLVGLITVIVLFVCLFTNIPDYLFNTLYVKPVLKKSDVIVVLAAGSTKSGLPCRHSLERMIKAVILYKEGYSKKIIFSGGTDTADLIPPARAMFNLAVKLGVKPTDIFVEDQSKDTYQNAVFSNNIMQKQKFKTVLLVTSESHIKRSENIFNKLGIETNPVYVEESIPPQNSSIKSKIYNVGALYKVFYEYLGFLKYKIKGWI